MYNINKLRFNILYNCCNIIVYKEYDIIVYKLLYVRKIILFILFYIIVHDNCKNYIIYFILYYCI